MSEIKTTLGDGRLTEALRRLEKTLAPGGDWTEANAMAAEFDRKEHVEGAKKRWEAFLADAGLEGFSEKISRVEITGSDEHKRFIAAYLDGFERAFNRKVPGMFVSGPTGIGKTYNALMCCKNAMWSPLFQRTRKTEWAGLVRELSVPGTCAYVTSDGLVSRLEGAWRKGFSRESVLSGLCSSDILVVDDAGLPSELGKRNAEIGAVTALMRAKPTGLVIQTRLSPAAFDELFGPSVADMRARFASPPTAGCASRRSWRTGAA